MKRFLASLLAVLMLVSLLPLSAFAAETKAATVADTQEPAQIVTQQLVLGDNLNMRFWVKANMENAAINVTIGSGETKSIALTEQDANGYYIVNVALAAAQMTDVITLQATAGDVTGTAKQYSVRQYADVILNGDYTEPTTNLVQVMLNYGAGAQVYFNYNNTADQLANKGYESNPTEALPEEQAVVVEGTTEGIRFYGVSLSFRDRIALRYYYTGDITGMTVNAGDKAYTIGQKDSLSYVELADINPQDYATVYTVSVGDGENPLSVGYSAMHYISRMCGKSSTSENLVNLLKWLNDYYKAAICYNEWLASCENLADYVIVYGDSATANEQTARDMIVEYIKKSTGVTLPVIPASEASYTADAKYLVIGNTGLGGFAPAANLGYRGYQIKSKDNSVFVCGGTDFGTLSGAVGFLEKVIGLDAYGYQTVNYNKQSEILIDNFDLTVVPDVGMEQPPFSMVSGNAWNQALWGVGQKMFSTIEGSSNHWHNSFDYLPPSEYLNSHPEYYVTEGYLWNKEAVQLSYTANGDAEAFEEMTTICANKIISSAQNNASMKAVTLTVEDNGSWDNSSAAQNLYNKYGTHSAELIIFVNAVADKVKAGLGDRELDIYFFAYYNTYKAPVKEVDGKLVAIDSDVEMRDNVGVIYAPINGDFLADDFTATTMYEELSGWAALTDNIATWTYQTNFDNYFNFYNSFNIMPSMYSALADFSTDYSYMQGQWNNPNSTGFSHLKTYLTGKLSWNADADFETLLDNYFAARFGSASSEMRTLFDSMRAYYDKLQDTYGISGGINQSGEYLRADRFEKSEIEKWLGYLDAAYAKADNDTIKSYIDLESLAVRYLMITLYGDTLAANDLMVMINSFKEDCAALNITMFNESNTIDYLWEQLDESTVTEIEGVYYNFDLSLGLTSYEIPVPASIGTVTAVYDDGYNTISGVTIGADSITFSAEAVAALLDGKSYGDFALYMTTADAIYRVNVAVVTKMISSYNDLVAIKANQVNSVLDGYYALANDIDATGEDAICLIDFNDYINNTTNSTKGFVGIFDGRGYTISNLTAKTGGYAKVGGFFGQILTGAVVRNIAFMDMTTDGATSYQHLLTGESCRMMGTMSNVVISAKGDVHKAFGIVGCDVSNTANASRGTMINVIISGADRLCFTIMNVPTMTNVIVVADTSLCEAVPSNEGDKAVYDSVTCYSSNEELFEALNTENVIAEWEDCDIAYENTAIKFNGKAIITEVMNIVETEAVIGTSTTLTTEGSVTLSLKEAVTGVSISGKTLTVASSVKEGTKITVVATSTVSGTVKEFVITCHRTYTDAVLGAMDVEIGATTGSMTVSGINGNTECLTYGTTTVYEGYTIADGTLTISQELLDAMYARLGVGEHTIYLGTDASYRYAITLTFATKIIKSQEDLLSIAKNAALDGYFILANDIVCDGATVINLSCYTSTTTSGFIGTFDGRGHTISNAYVGKMGFFKGIGAGTVKNVAFVNVIASSDGWALAQENHGLTLENVFVSTNVRQMFDSCWDGMTMKNVVFVSEQTNGRVFTQGANGTLTWNNVAVVGSSLYGYWGSTANKTNSVFYADTVDLLTGFAAEDELAKWADSSFNYADGMIYFGDNVVLQYNIDLRGENIIYRGTEQTYRTSDSDLELKNEIDGVELSGPVIDGDDDVYTLTVDYTVPEGTEIVIVAYSWDFETVTKEIVVTVKKQYNNVDLTSQGNMADVSLADESTSVAVPFTVVGISYGDSDIITEGVSFADGKLTLTKAVLNAMAAKTGLGEQTLYLYTDNDYCYAVTVTLATKVIKNQEDLLSIAKNAALDGYFILANDIVCDGTTVINLSCYTSTTTSGFIGTFDGRDHSISNVNVGEYGLFKGIGTGTVKNLALINVIGTKGALGLEVHGATFENLFISGSTPYIVDTNWDTPTYKNVVLVSSDANGRIFRSGSTGTLTMTNVYSVGTVLYTYYGAATNLTNTKYFADANALLAAISAEGELDKWAGSSFSVADGVLSFGENEVCKASVTLNGAAVIIRGTSETYTSTGTISLKEAIDGVSITDGVLSVAVSVPVDTVITLVATHPQYPAITAELNVQVSMVYEQIDLTSLGSIGDLETADSYSEIELPKQINGNVVGISIADTAKYSSGISVSDGVLSIANEWVTGVYNACGYTEQNIMIYTDTDKCYTVTIAIVTKAIANQADLQSISANAALNGYFVLTEDIGCDGTTVINLSCYTSTTTSGFIGTFDGRGHSISNVNVGEYGLFKGIGTGTVKNLALINVIGTKGALGLEVHGATFENLFISGSTPYIVDTNWDTPTYKNVVLVSSDANGRIFRSGSTGTLTMTNVYSVGTVLYTYYGAATNLTNTKYFADANALLAAISAEGELDKWADSSFSYANGIVFFGGKPVFFTEVALSNPVDLGEIEAVATENVINIPSEISGNIIGYSVGNAGRMSEGLKCEDGKLILSEKAVKSLAVGGWGETTLNLYTDEGKFYTVSVFLVTKILRNQADLQSISVNAALDGYYVLANDIVCDGTTAINLSCYTSTTTSGFIGTFDGRGYTISNAYVGKMGFFKGIGAGTVKNVAFVNVISDGWALAQEIHGSTIENVFVSTNVRQMFDTCWNNMTFKDVIFVSALADGRIFTQGSSGTLTMNNVFAVGSSVYGYWGSTANNVNANAYADVAALLSAFGAAGELDKWTGSSFTVADGKLLFNGKVVAQ